MLGISTEIRTGWFKFCLFKFNISFQFCLQIVLCKNDVDYFWSLRGKNVARSKVKRSVLEERKLLKIRKPKYGIMKNRVILKHRVQTCRTDKNH